VFALCVLTAVLVGMHYLKQMVNDFTDAKPMELPAVQMPAAEIEKLKQRVDAFRQAVNDRHPADALELTGDDINALIASDPQYRALKGRVYVTIEGGRIKGQISAPLDELGLNILKGRYLNGEAVILLSFHDGILVVSPESIAVKGKLIPEKFMDSLRKQNFAADANSNSQGSTALDKIQEIQVKDGKLIIVPKQP